MSSVWLCIVARWRYSFLLVSMLASQQVVSGEDYLYGLASYQPSGIQGYIAGLYLDDPAQALENDEILERSSKMAFKIALPRVSSRSWGKDLIQKAAINNSSELVAQHVNSIQTFSSFLTEWFYQGDLIELHKKADGMAFHVNNVEVAFIAEPELFQLLLKAWIGSIPPSSNFKNQLLSGSVEDSYRADFLDQTTYVKSKGRVLAWRDQFTDSANTAAPVSAAISANPAKAQAPALALKARNDADLIAKERQRLARKEAELKAREAQIEAERALREEKQREEENKKALAALFETYTRLVYQHPLKFVKYPIRSQARKEQGSVEVLVQVERDGSVVKAALESSSNYPRLDEAAIAAAYDSTPFPVVPEGIEGELFEFVIPLSFRMP